MVYFSGPVIVVEDEIVSRDFYIRVLEQKLKNDFGASQAFESGLCLQRKNSMKEIFSIDEEKIRLKTNNVVLYFETHNFDGFIDRLKKEEGLEYIHNVLEQPWKQRSVSFYDPDGHPIDVSESMESVFIKLYKTGISIEEVAKVTEHPLDFVKAVLSELK